MPYKPWNGVGSNTNWRSTSGFGGYCTHSSILFLTWHRPYLALYEVTPPAGQPSPTREADSEQQSLYNAVQKVARRFPKGALRDRYLEAAKTFRAPYFDWASQPPSGNPAFPSALISPKVQVIDVDGGTKFVNNPLYRYSFHRVTPAPGDFSRRVNPPLTRASPNPIHELTDFPSSGVGTGRQSDIPISGQAGHRILASRPS